MRGEGDQSDQGGADPGDDELLIKAASQGNARAFRALAERHYDRVFRLCFGVIGDASEAEDLTQEIWASMPRRLKTFRGEARFTTWLHRVSVNAARDALRRRAARSRATEIYTDLEEMGRGETEEAARRLLWLQEALAQLSAELRETAALILGEELSHGEAAEVLGVAESTVSWRMSEIRRRLRIEARQSEV